MEIAFANAGVFGLIEGAVECSTTVACLVISLSSAILCGFIIDNVESLNLKVGESSTPKVVTFIVTLLMAKMMLFPFDLACDTIMHCFVVNEAMAPAKFREEFEKVKKDKDAKKVDGKKKTLKLRVGVVECMKQEAGCAELGITKFPTVRFYRAGADPVDFDSFFDSGDLKQFADARLKEMPKIEVKQLEADLPEDGSAEKVNVEL